MIMVGFGIITGIGQDGQWIAVLQGRLQQRHEAIDIDLGPPAYQDRQQEMAGAIDGSFQLGEAAVGNGFPGLIDLLAPAHVIKTSSSQVQACGIESGSRHSTASLEKTPHRGMEQVTCVRSQEETATGFLQGGEVRNEFQLQGFLQIREVPQESDDAAIIEAEKGFEDQTSK